MPVLPTLRRTRPLLLVAALLAALLGLTTQAAAPAHAAALDRWGFVYLDNPTPPTGYVPDPSRQWGSWPSPSANPVTVTQTGLGQYTVHYPLIAGSGGIAHVTAVSGNGDWCQLTGWGPNGTGEDVGVACYTASGLPDNSRFTALYTTVPVTSVSGGWAYLYADVSGAILTSYNSAGATNTVSKGGVGLWKVWLPNEGGATPVGDFQVTAVDAGQAVHCSLANWGPGASGQTGVVQCYNAAGALTDTRWTLSYAVQRSVIGRAFPPKAFGYLWFNGSVPAGTNYNSAGGGNGLATSGPSFTVSMPNIANTPDHAQVTAYGPTPTYCDLTAPWDRLSGVATLYVTCYKPGGAPTSNPFFAAYTGAF